MVLEREDSTDRRAQIGGDPHCTAMGSDTSLGDQVLVPAASAGLTRHDAIRGGGSGIAGMHPERVGKMAAAAEAYFRSISTAGWRRQTDSQTEHLRPRQQQHSLWEAEGKE